MSGDDLEQRINELEIQLAYANQRISELDGAVLESTQKTLELERSMELMEKALKRMNTQKEPQLIGDGDQNDPVPSSG